MAVSPRAFCLSLVLCVCGVGCGAAEPNLTASDVLPRLRYTPTPSPVPVDQLNTVNYNSSDHETLYNLDGEDFEGRQGDTQRESQGKHYISFSKYKNYTVIGLQRDTAHSKNNSLLLDAKSMNNVSIPYFYETVQSVSPENPAGTPFVPGQRVDHNADQFSRNTSSGFNSVQNRTHEGDVTHIGSERPSVSVSNSEAGVADHLDRFRSSRKDIHSHNSDSRQEVTSVPPPRPEQRLCVVTQLPPVPTLLPHHSHDDSRPSTGVTRGSLGPPGEDEQESIGRYTVTCDASVSLNNLSMVAEVAYKRRTINL